MHALVQTNADLLIVVDAHSCTEVSEEGVVHDFLAVRTDAPHDPARPIKTDLKTLITADRRGEF